jgi:hypothetical protein
LTCKFLGRGREAKAIKISLKLSINPKGIMSELLYHATFVSRLGSIKKLGLGGKQLKAWSFSIDGVVCFSDDPWVAMSYAEIADEISDEEYNTGIVVLAVNKGDLDTSLLSVDENNSDGDTLQYAGIVPASKLLIWKWVNEIESTHPFLNGMYHK